MNGIETEYWERVEWACPRCLKDYEPEDAELPPPSLALVDSADRSIDSRAIWGVGDEHDHDFDFEMWTRGNSTEPVVFCRECETVFDVTFTAHEGGDE